MKKNLTQWLGSAFAALLMLAFASTVQAQNGTQNDNFLFRVSTSAGNSDYSNGACGYGHSLFGGGITQEICGEIVWAYDITPDSICCDTITQDLTGKIAFIRRGTCNFSLKVWYAQQAGAKAVIIANHYNTATDDGCTIINMAAGTNAALDTIPSIEVCRNVAEEIDNALKAGETVTGCFLLPRFYDAAGPYHYSTPVSQVDSLLNMGVRYVNRSNATQENVVLKAEITEPGGNVVTLTTTLDTVGAGSEVFSYFPGYLPPAVAGEFTTLYTNNKYNESRDSLRSKFAQTPYTFASDNLSNDDPGGVGTTNANFISGGFVHQEGAICITGPNGGNATFATFGISNIDSVFVPNVPPGGTANDINVFVYDGDVDENGTIDLSSSFDDLTQVGYGVYTMDGTETDGQLVDVPVADLVTGQPIELKPRHVYYISLYYNGLEAGYGRDIRFSDTRESWFYLNFPSTPLSVGNGTALTFYNGGWAGADVIQRLQLDGYQPGTSVKPNVLDDAQVTVTPNPAVDQMRVNVNLNEASDLVTLTLFDAQGRMVKTQKVGNFEDGQITMNVGDVASGMYLLWVRTAEGSAMRKVAICH